MLTAGVVEIRPEQSADHESVLAVHAAAFADHGGVVINLVKALRDLVTPTAGLSLVADINGRVIGHVMSTPSLLDAPSRLVSVDVLSRLPSARTINAAGSVGRSSKLALRYRPRGAYRRFSSKAIPATTQRSGFQQAGSLGFRRPSLRIPQPAFQVMRLPT